MTAIDYRVCLVSPVGSHQHPSVRYDRAMIKYLAAAFFVSTFLVPFPSFAVQNATVPNDRAALLATLRAELNTLLKEVASLQAQLAVLIKARASDPPPTLTKPPVQNTSQASSLHARPTDSLYMTGDIGYDISFNTKAYPPIPFGFAVVGVSGGKAFTDNPRLPTEISWAHFASNIRPTLYMNINAPYGSTVAGHIGDPRTCTGITRSSKGAAAKNGEPTACEGYNYGYNAAKHAYTYAQENGVSSPFWWLDVEEANSWSATTTVNDATIQGAIDYLNTQGIRVEIYSVPYMWHTIAGADFVPTQKINGHTISIPTWFPIGIAREVTALNACLTANSFIADSPVWIIQYETSPTAVDQNISC